MSLKECSGRNICHAVSELTIDKHKVRYKDQPEEVLQ